ncbi:hypothetical protein NKR19_g485 [Coniochaeta hoffmannii]|uniref:Uncharacterized protein n=1 Tax=Coniochaeta hoffmannii TaxID=91930 RepID=A0AA38SEB6_9PEZI|nr:hypothetical protein NKR19_g485 [Coniochaeta hoffmannii]
MLLTSRLRPVPRFRHIIRSISTLPANPHIKVFPNAANPGTYVLTFLDTDPPDHNLAIGTTTTVPPTPNSFRENRRFLQILNDVLAQHAQHDKDLISQAQAFAGPGGAMLGSGGAFFPQTNRRQRTTQGGSGGAGGTGAGGASGQGGAGGAGRGGWVHLSDKRNPPDFGRIAWPEDILGSVEVDGHGEIIGNFQPSGTYRIVTNEGILGLSDYLREKLVSRLRAEERKS